MKRRAAGTLEEMPSFGEHNGVVHIREVDGKLCVVRTVYPSDYGSPVWKGECDRQVEVRKEPPAPFPVTGNILKVQLSEGEGDTEEDAFNPTWMPDNLAGEGLSLETQERCSLLESGYASDLPLTSPETAVTTSSQVDWEKLTNCSSERLDAMAESPQALQRQQAADRHLPQVSSDLFNHSEVNETTLFFLFFWERTVSGGV